MKFIYLEDAGSQPQEDAIPGDELAAGICAALEGDGPHERGDYGWEWSFRRDGYKALAVLQQYESGWLVAVDVRLMDRLFGRGGAVLADLKSGIRAALGSRVTKVLEFETEQEFRDSNV